MLAVTSFSLMAISIASLSQAYAHDVNIETLGDLVARTQTPTYQGLPKVLDSRTTGELCLAGNDCIDGQCIPNFETTIDDPIVYDDPVPGDTSGSWSCSASAMFCGGVFCSTGNICLGDGVCGVASEDSSTSTPVTTSSLMVGSGKPSPTAMGKPTGSTTTLASGTNIGAEATPAT
ncbi:hypothetical protein IFR04_004320 [Cadophora malorum]|uniref:Uncharacterized protein n=1 Tax=Cadophora malorum TaxID=108018 RepID=A0A8H7WD05_9HELO|nr:hypothetical protein IFR04_004320 [Cadophora malorum]